MIGIYKKAGKRIKEIRLQLDITQEQLAELSDIHISYLSQIERGITKFSLNTLKKISDALNVSLAEILDFTKKPMIKSDDILYKYFYKMVNSLGKKDKHKFIDIFKRMVTLYKKKK